MKNITKFKHYQTDNQIDLYVCKNPKFKTNLIQFLIINPLREDTVSKNAMVPFMMYRGSKKYPTSRDFKLRLDELYGAELTVSVWKRGENQIINFSLEIPNEKYLPTDEQLLEKGFNLIRELIVNPLFTEEYFQQERDYIIKEIKSLINDKYTYSLVKCYQTMCNEEAYGLYKLGKIEDYQNITCNMVVEQYKNMLAGENIYIFVVGDVDEDRVHDKVNSIMNFEHRQSGKVNHTNVIKEVDDVRLIEEKLSVQQGKLVIGFRTGITRSDELYYPLILFNGILGGFPHSKLFQNVREKASLAYYAGSNIESTKGLLVITSGIEFTNFEKAREIIMEQLDNMKNGEISTDELEWTRKSIISQYLSSADHIKGLSGHYLLGLINGIPESLEKSIERLSRVSREEIINSARNIKLDTIYFLNGKVED